MAANQENTEAIARKWEQIETTFEEKMNYIDEMIPKIKNLENTEQCLSPFEEKSRRLLECMEDWPQQKNHYRVSNNKLRDSIDDLVKVLKPAQEAKTILQDIEQEYQKLNKKLKDQRDEISIDEKASYLALKLTRKSVIDQIDQNIQKAYNDFSSADFSSLRDRISGYQTFITQLENSSFSNPQGKEVATALDNLKTFSDHVQNPSEAERKIIAQVEGGIQAVLLGVRDRSLDDFQLYIALDNVKQESDKLKDAYDNFSSLGADFSSLGNRISRYEKFITQLEDPSLSNPQGEVVTALADLKEFLAEQEFIIFIKGKNHKRQINGDWSQVEDKETPEDIAALQKTLQSCIEDIQGDNSYETSYKTALTDFGTALEEYRQLLMKPEEAKEEERKAVKQKLIDTFTDLNKKYTPQTASETERKIIAQVEGSIRKVLLGVRDKSLSEEEPEQLRLALDKVANGILRLKDTYDNFSSLGTDFSSLGNRTSRYEKFITNLENDFLLDPEKKVAKALTYLKMFSDYVQNPSKEQEYFTKNAEKSIQAALLKVQSLSEKVSPTKFTEAANEKAQTEAANEKAQQELKTTMESHKRQITDAWKNLTVNHTPETSSAFQKTLQSCSDAIQGQSFYERSCRTAINLLKEVVKEFGQANEAERTVIVPKLTEAFTNLYGAFKGKSLPTKTALQDKSFRLEFRDKSLSEKESEQLRSALIEVTNRILGLKDTHDTFSLLGDRISEYQTFITQLGDTSLSNPQGEVATALANLKIFSDHVEKPSEAETKLIGSVEKNIRKVLSGVRDRSLSGSQLDQALNNVKQESARLKDAYDNFSLLDANLYSLRDRISRYKKFITNLWNQTGSRSSSDGGSQSQQEASLSRNPRDLPSISGLISDFPRQPILPSEETTQNPDRSHPSDLREGIEPALNNLEEFLRSSYTPVKSEEQMQIIKNVEGDIRTVLLKFKNQPPNQFDLLRNLSEIENESKKLIDSLPTVDTSNSNSLDDIRQQNRNRNRTPLDPNQTMLFRSLLNAEIQRENGNNRGDNPDINGNS